MEEDKGIIFRLEFVKGIKTNYFIPPYHYRLEGWFMPHLITSDQHETHDDQKTKILIIQFQNKNMRLLV